VRLLRVASRCRPRRQVRSQLCGHMACERCSAALRLFLLAPGSGFGCGWQLGYSRFRSAAGSLMLRHRRPSIQTVLDAGRVGPSAPDTRRTHATRLPSANEESIQHSRTSGERSIS
jgi:hypothetical protein